MTIRDRQAYQHDRSASILRVDLVCAECVTFELFRSGLLTILEGCEQLAFAPLTAAHVEQVRVQWREVQRRLRTAGIDCSE